MTDDMIKEHLARAHLAESVTLDAGTWTEVLEEVQRLRELHELYKDKTERLREVSYDLLGELSAHRAALAEQLTDEQISVLWHQSGEQPFKFARMISVGRT